MSSIADKSACELAGQGQEDGLLPVSPFTALQVHFGMLLGVDDLETLQAISEGQTPPAQRLAARRGCGLGL